MQTFIQRLSIIMGGALLPLVSLADGGGEFSHQLEEIFPFEHVGEGHWFAFIVLLILWISFIYNVYTFIKKRGQGSSSM